MLLGAVGLLMAINQVFSLRTLGLEPLGNSFLYYMIGVFLSVAFLNVLARSGMGSGPGTIGDMRSRRSNLFGDACTCLESYPSGKPVLTPVP